MGQERYARVPAIPAQLEKKGLQRAGEIHYLALMRTILFIVLILLLIGAFPTWPYSTGWGYYPVGGIGLILLILLILAVVGRI